MEKNGNKKAGGRKGRERKTGTYTEGREGPVKERKGKTEGTEKRCDKRCDTRKHPYGKKESQQRNDHCCGANI